MTQEELEKLGYEFGSEDTAGGHTYHNVCKEDVAGFLTSFDSRKSGDEGLQECIEAATAHAQHQQEIAELRDQVEHCVLYDYGPMPFKPIKTYHMQARITSVTDHTAPPLSEDDNGE